MPKIITAPKVIRNNSQAKGPILDDTLESDMAPTKQLYDLIIFSLHHIYDFIIKESFR